VTELKKQPDSVGLNVADACVIDMHRTFPDNVYFRDDRTDSQAKCATLFNVLTALAHNNRQVGYCQVTLVSIALCLVNRPLQLTVLPVNIGLG